jgi:hypothetical protein
MFVVARRWWCILLLGVAPALCGQQTELDRLVAESARLRERARTARFTRPEWTNLKHLVRDWIESRLPANLPALDREYQGLEAQLRAELWKAAVLAREWPGADAGYVSAVKLSRPTEYPDVLAVRAGVTVGCGADESILLYRFKGGSRTRLLEADGTHEWGSSVAETHFSSSDRLGRHLFFAAWYGVQCASVWDVLDYRVFRIDADGDQAVSLLSENHLYTLFDEQAKLMPEELLLELTGQAMEIGWRRTYVMRYSIGSDGVKRVDPVALQPQDFVHESMIRPWDEMQSRSSDGLEKWHKFLHAASGEYELAQPCAERSGVTQVGVALDSIGELEMPEPLDLYFLVEDQGGYHYKMSEISFSRQEGCPGETQATYDNLPSLFPKK